MRYPYHVVGGSGHRVGSFETLEDAKEYSQLHPAWSVLTPRLIFQTPSKSCPLRKLNGSLVTVMGVGGGWRKVRRIGGYAREYAVRFPDGNVYWAFPDELFIPAPEVTE